MKVSIACLVATAALLVVGQVSGQTWDYKEALSKSILFYEAQRSGRLPADNRVPWRGDTFLGDGSEHSVDLSGGYFDAGDHVKFGFPFSHSMIMLAWGLVDYRAGYEAAGELDRGLDTLRWGADWILKASSEIDTRNRVYGQSGSGNEDHAYWGRPEEQNQVRPSYYISNTSPGTDLACNYASALALTSVAMTPTDPTYAAELLAVARKLYTFGKTYRGTYSASSTMGDAGSFYRSNDPNDELTFSAAVMALVTDEQEYKTDAASYWNQWGYGTYTQTFFDWDNKHIGIAVILSKVLGDAAYRTSAQTTCEYWINQERRTPNGLVYINEWGSLRHAANAAFGCLLVADLGVGTPATYRSFAKQQIDYALGSTGRSFVVGFGVNPPQKVHHRGASCPDLPASCGWNEFNSPNPNGQVLEGALAGGPDVNDNYQDDRNNYQQNEVALDYNAGYQSALAGLIVNFP